MTPFKRRPHLRIAGALADDTTPVEATMDPASPPAQPPPPRTVEAQASDLLPDQPTAPAASSKHGPGELILQGIFVGIGYGLATEILKAILGPKRGGSSPAMSGVRRRKSLEG